MSKHSSKTAETAIRVVRVSVMFNGTPVLRDATLDVPAGGLTAIVGANGSGKTTLVRAMLGLVPLSGGSVAFFGKPLGHMRARIGYVPQRFDFDRDMPVTVAEFLALARRRGTTAANIAHTLRDVGLMPSAANKRLGALSGGQLQRVLIAQATLNNPAILFLDEPAAGIDVEGEATVMDVLDHLREEHGTTIVMITHDVDVLDNRATQMVRMDYGRARIL